jgi:hypothetical protein
MGHKEVTEPPLRTKFASTVRVRVLGDVDTRIGLQLEFPSAPSEGGQRRFSRVTFKSVFEYRWVFSETEYFAFDRRDFKFSLIEIIDSEQVKAMVNLGMLASQPEGKRLGQVADERSVRHFRIGFDDYGTFDVIALEVEIEKVLRDGTASSRIMRP